MPINARNDRKSAADNPTLRDGGGCHCTELRKASRRISQLFDSALEPSGLKITQRAILAQIERTAPITVGQLARALVMDSGALAHNLQPLHRDGLVVVAVDAQDRRNRLVTLTRTGRSRLAQTDRLWAQAQRGFETALGRAESQALREAVRFLVTDDFVADFEKGLCSSPP